MKQKSHFCYFHFVDTGIVVKVSCSSRWLFRLFNFSWNLCRQFHQNWSVYQVTKCGLAKIGNSKAWWYVKVANDEAIYGCFYDGIKFIYYTYIIIHPKWLTFASLWFSLGVQPLFTFIGSSIFNCEHCFAHLILK